MRALRAIVTVLVSLHVPFASAQPVIIADSGDSAWMLTASVLVLLTAIPGLILLYAGITRTYIISSTLMIAIVITSLVSLIWAAAGYSLTFGHGSVWLGGLGNFGLANLSEIRDGTTISENLFALFQMTFAVTTIILIISAFGHRLRLGWIVGFTVFWFMLVYVPVTRWLWGGGWLAERGTLDFAGGIVVHTTAGVTALVIALLLGKEASAIAPVTAPVTADRSGVSLAGAGLLWIGSFALNGGASLAAGADAASAVLNTHFAASAAVVVWMIVERLSTGQLSMTGLATGAVAGLAAIAAAADFVGPFGAVLLGSLGSLATFGAIFVTKRSAEGKGSLLVFAVHGVAGIVGSLLFPLFVLPVFGGPGYDEGVMLVAQFGAQAVGIGSVVLWTSIMTAIVALMVAMVIPMQAEAAAN